MDGGETMFESDAVFVDIETNGGNSERGRVIEVAAIKVSGDEIIDTFTSLINPGGDIPYWITKLTGITTSDVIDAPYFDDIADQLYQFLDGAIFVAHNVLFDYSFLKREFAAHGFDFHPKLFCTVKMSRALWPEHTGHSLEKIIARHQIPVSARHRAYDDAKAMYDFVRLTIAAKGSASFMANIARQLKTKSLPPHVDEAVILALPDGPGIYIFEDDAGTPLYVGKSVNISTMSMASMPPKRRPKRGSKQLPKPLISALSSSVSKKPPARASATSLGFARAPASAKSRPISTTDASNWRSNAPRSNRGHLPQPSPCASVAPVQSSSINGS